MARISAFAKNNLNKLGFGKLDEEAKTRYMLALRFTLGVATVLIVIGLALRSPIWLGSMALIALSGALLPNGMLIDLVYNLGVRHLFGAPPLPPTPKHDNFPTFFPLSCWQVQPCHTIMGYRYWDLSWEEWLS